MTDTLDIIAEMQHRNRSMVHEVMGLRAMAQNAVSLWERDGQGQPEYVESHLVHVLRILASKCEVIEEALQTPPPNGPT